MSEQVPELAPDDVPSPPAGEIVHWMSPKPLSLGAAGISAATASAFALGLATSVLVLALLHWLGPQRVLPHRAPRWR